MPIPLRTTSKMAPSNNRQQLHPPRSWQRIQPHESRDHDAEKASKEENATAAEDVVSSVGSAKGSGNTSHTSSRIPSPTKQDSLSLSNRGLSSTNSREKAPPKGHVRQRSAAIPPSDTSKKLGHTRSISAVSVNTTSTSSSDPPKNGVKPTPMHKSRNISSPTKLRPVSQHQRLGGLGTDPSSRSSHALPHDERLRNDLFQLSIVHNESSLSLPAYHKSIEGIISLKNAELQAVHCSTQDMKQSWSTALNLRAIDSWLQASGHQKTCQSLQNLSVAVRDLSNLERIFEGDDGLAVAFDCWHQRIDSADGDSTSDVPNDHVFLHLTFETQLFPELQIFLQRIAVASATLSNFPYTPPDSSLARVIQSQLRLAKMMELQCQVMLSIGEKLVSAHHRWLRREIDNALSVNNCSQDTTRTQCQPMWSL